MKALNYTFLKTAVPQGGGYITGGLYIYFVIQATDFS